MGSLFVRMARMYPWATKEYLLWNMTIGQIILYLNVGTDLDNPPSEGQPSLVGKPHSELKKIREEMIAQGLIQDPSKEELKEKYGDI